MERAEYGLELFLRIRAPVTAVVKFTIYYIVEGCVVQ